MICAQGERSIEVKCIHDPDTIQNLNIVSESDISEIYSGGLINLNKFIIDNIDYSAIHNIPDAIWVAFVIDTNGAFQNTCIYTQPIGNDFSEIESEINRVLGLLPGNKADTSVPIRVKFPLVLSHCIGGCFLDRNTPGWFFLMNRSTIGNIPISNPIDDVKYYYDGEIAERWEISYKSNSRLEVIKAELEEYLLLQNSQFDTDVSCYNGVWDISKETVKIRCKSSKGNCIIVYLDDNGTNVLVRVLEMN